MRDVGRVAAFVVGCSCVTLIACGDDDSGTTAQVAGKGGDTANGGSGGSKSSAGSGGSKSTAGHGGSGADMGDAGEASGASQTPPQGADAIEAWISEGHYKTWHCEDTVHASRSPSPHGFNRICSNDSISTHATEDHDWEQGAAAVKELYADESASKPIGYAVYLKTDSQSAGGAHWYWYERVPLDSQVPHDSKGVVADGFGDSGPAQTICVGCHAAAGSDPAHTPSAGGRDQVYTPVH